MSCRRTAAFNFRRPHPPYRHHDTQHGRAASDGECRDHNVRQIDVPAEASALLGTAPRLSHEADQFITQRGRRRLGLVAARSWEASERLRRSCFRGQIQEYTFPSPVQDSGLAPKAVTAWRRGLPYGQDLTGQILRMMPGIICRKFCLTKGGKCHRSRQPNIGAYATHRGCPRKPAAVFARSQSDLAGIRDWKRSPKFAL